MSEFKKAVVVGKVNLPTRREVVIEKPKPQVQVEIRRPAEFKPAQGGGRRKDARDSEFNARASNQMQLQELQYIKKQLRASDEELGKLRTAHGLFVADVRRLVVALQNGGGSPELTPVLAALGMDRQSEAPAAVPVPAPVE